MRAGVVEAAARTRTAIRSVFFMGGMGELVAEDVAFGLAVSGDERVQDLVLEREEILEEALQLVRAAAGQLAEVLELVLQQLLSVAAVEHEEDDVEQESGLLDVDLAGV